MDTQVLIDTLIDQRNEALNQVAMLRAENASLRKALQAAQQEQGAAQAEAAQPEEGVGGESLPDDAVE